MATAPTIHHLFLLKWWWASPGTFFFLLNRLAIRFHPHQLSIQTTPGVPSGFFLLFFFLVVLAFCFSSQMETPAILQAYFNRRSSASRNLPNPRSLELSYGQSQYKYRKTTAGNLTERHTLANVRFPHHIRATSSNRSSSYRPE